jgi:dihydrolipoamide dehydrogenase
VDVAVIGAGTAGLAAYTAARAAGASALLIEGGAHGTTCARLGCMPSKLLIAAADAAHAVETAPGFGVRHAGGVRIDGRAVMVESGASATGSSGSHCATSSAFPPRTAWTAVPSSWTTTRSRWVGTRGSSRGRWSSRPAPSPRAPIRSTDLATARSSATMYSIGWTFRRPWRSSVSGSSAWSSGRRCIVWGFGSPCSGAAAGSARSAIRRSRAPCRVPAGIHAGADARSDMRRDADGVTIRRTTDGALQVEQFERVLVIPVERPASGIGLDKTSVKLDPGGVPVYDRVTAQTHGSEKHGSPIFIAGDAGDSIPLLHEAIAGMRRAPIAIVFTDPQIGIVGSGFDSLRPGSFVVGRIDFENQGRARIQLRNKGQLNVYAETATGHFGAEMLAPGVISAHLRRALQNRMTVTQMLGMPYYHPVLEERAPP